MHASAAPAPTGPAEVSIVPLSDAVGARVHCGAIADLGTTQAGALRAGLLAHQVLLLRGPVLDDPALLAFGRLLGELDTAPLAYTDNQKARQHEEVLIVSNVKENGLPIGVLGDAEVVWHSDNSYRETPLSYSLLHAVELPESGGDTGFSNMYLGLETLPPELVRRLCTLQIKHDITYNSAGDLRRGYEAVSDPVSAPGPCHPIVRTHPETGRNALYLGRRPNAYVCGLPLAESEALLDMLWAHATQPRFTWYHRWRKGDILIWDNRCLMHRREAFDPAARRVMHRLQYRGDRPYHDAGVARAVDTATR